MLETNAFDDSLISTGRGDNTTYKILPPFGTDLTAGGTNKITINGSSVSGVYQVGGDGQTGALTIQGYAKQIVNAMPISFYASGIDNKPAAMTIESVNVWMPEYNGEDYSKIKQRVHISDMSILGHWLLGSIIKIALGVFGLWLDDGLQRNELMAFVDPNTITFNGIPTNGYFSNGNVVVLRGEDTNKSITPGLIDKFLEKKFSIEGQPPATFIGLHAILNAEYGSNGFTYKPYTDASGKAYDAAALETLAIQTAEALYNKVKGKVGDLMAMVANSPTHLMHVLRDVRVEIKIKNYPYEETYTNTDPKSPLNPIVLWGLNANLPN